MDIIKAAIRVTIIAIIPLKKVFITQLFYIRELLELSH